MKHALKARKLTSVLALAFLGALLVSSPFLNSANAQASTFLLNNNAFNSTTPYLVVVPNSGQPAPWEAIIQPYLQYATANNQSRVDLLSVTGGTLSASSSGYVCTANAGETCSYAQISVYLEQAGGLTIFYQANSSQSSSGATIYTTTSNVLGTGCYSGSPCNQNLLYLDLQPGPGDVGLLNFYTVTPDGKTVTELGNVTLTGFSLTHVAGYDPESGTHAGDPTASGGYVQITLNDLPASVNVTSMMNVVVAIIPVVVILAVVGWLKGFFKGMNF